MAVLQLEPHEPENIASHLFIRPIRIGIMGILTSGEYFDGTPIDYIDYTSPIGMFAAFVSFSYFIATAAMIVLLAKGWLGISKSKVYYFVWTINIIQLIYFTTLFFRYTPSAFPLLSWAFAVLGTITLYVVIMGQLEILKVFTVNSSFLNRQVVYYCQIAFSVYSLVCLGGLYFSVLYVGYSRPAILDKWHSIGYIAFALTCLVYETFHAIYVSKSVVEQVQKRRQLQNTNIINEERAFDQLYYLVVLCIIIDWTAAIIWTSAWFLPKSNDATAIGVIGDAIGVGHILFMTAIFKKLKFINVKKIKNSKFESNVQQSSVAIFKTEDAQPYF
ncbi:hypothetical protein HDV06_006631 [Boothiomyces sp. JEL0866]|nr:hypothetical protein HDV06_006631 [Boothiomyces sp. JEL0866]